MSSGINSLLPWPLYLPPALNCTPPRPAYGVQAASPRSSLLGAVSGGERRKNLSNRLQQILIARRRLLPQIAPSSVIALRLASKGP